MRRVAVLRCTRRAMARALATTTAPGSAKRVVVMGGCGTLGRAVVDTFSSAGWTATSVDIAESPVASSSIVLPTAGDWTTLLDDSAAVDASASPSGKYDAIVCAAGGWAGGAPSDDGFMGSLDYLYRVNLMTAAAAARLAALHLAPGGLLALTGAAAALEGGTPGMAAYGMTKAATHHLVKSMATKGALPDGCSSLAVLPVTIDTPTNREGMPDADFSTWTPPSAFADLLLTWADSEAAREKSGSLVIARTVAGETSFEVIEG